MSKCPCVRRADRKYCMCAKHDEFREFLSTLMLTQKTWHEDAELVDCTCHLSVTLTSTSMVDASVKLTCGQSTKIVINAEIGKLGQINTFDYRCAVGECQDCKDKFPSCDVLRNPERRAKWRAYECVVKLRKNEKLGRNGLLTNGKRPKKAKELVDKTGTRLQFMNAFKNCWTIYREHC